MVLGTDVVCRAQPDRDAPVVGALEPGDFFGAGDFILADSEDAKSGDVEVGDVLWVEQDGWAFRGSCWMFGPLTVSYDPQDPDRALLAVAEHVLGLGSEASLEHLVRVDNLLRERELRLGGFFRSGEMPRCSGCAILKLSPLRPRRSATVDPWIAMP